MRYLKVENGIPREYTLKQLFEDYQNATICKDSEMPNEDLLAQYSVYPLITEAKPITLESETVEESIPEFKDGEWHQIWLVRKLTSVEIDNLIDNATTDYLEMPFGLENDLTHTTPPMQTERITICSGCEYFSSLKICEKIGVIVPLKIKLYRYHCPIDKW
jgi:hypothetical protein